MSHGAHLTGTMASNAIGEKIGVVKLRIFYPSMCPSVHVSVRPSMCPSIHVSVRPSVHVSVRPCVHPSMCPSVHVSIRPCVHPSMCPSIRPAGRLAVRLSGFPAFRLFLSPTVLSLQLLFLSPCSPNCSLPLFPSSFPPLSPAVPVTCALCAYMSRLNMCSDVLPAGNTRRRHRYSSLD